MNHDLAISVLDQPHPAQDEFYMGGSDTAVQQFLPQFTGGLSSANRMTVAYHYLRG